MVHVGPSFATHFSPCSAPSCASMRISSLCACSQLMKQIRELIQLKNCPAHLFLQAGSKWHTNSCAIPQDGIVYTVTWGQLQVERGRCWWRSLCNVKLYPLAIWLQVYQCSIRQQKLEFSGLHPPIVTTAPGTVCAQNSPLPSHSYTWLKSQHGPGTIFNKQFASSHSVLGRKEFNSMVRVIRCQLASAREQHQACLTYKGRHESPAQTQTFHPLEEKPTEVTLTHPHSMPAKLLGGPTCILL